MKRNLSVVQNRRMYLVYIVIYSLISCLCAVIDKYISLQLLCLILTAQTLQLADQLL